MQYSLDSSGLRTTYLFNSNRFISAKEICSTVPAADRLWHELEAEAPKEGEYVYGMKHSCLQYSSALAIILIGRIPGGLFGVCTACAVLTVTS